MRTCLKALFFTGLFVFAGISCKAFETGSAGSSLFESELSGLQEELSVLTDRRTSINNEIAHHQGSINSAESVGSTWYNPLTWGNSTNVDTEGRITRSQEQISDLGLQLNTLDQQIADQNLKIRQFTENAVVEGRTSSQRAKSILTHLPSTVATPSSHGAMRSVLESREPTLANREPTPASNYWSNMYTNATNGIQKLGTGIADTGAGVKAAYDACMARGDSWVPSRMQCVSRYGTDYNREYTLGSRKLLDKPVYYDPSGGVVQSAHQGHVNQNFQLSTGVNQNYQLSTLPSQTQTLNTSRTPAGIACPTGFTYNTHFGACAQLQR